MGEGRRYVIVSLRMVERFGGRGFCWIGVLLVVGGVGVVGLWLLLLLAADGEEGALVKGVEVEEDVEEEEEE